LASNKTVAFIRGKLYWPKVFGEPRPNYAGDGREWTFEIEPDEEGLATCKKLGITGKLKDKYEDRGKYLTLKRRELTKSGEKNSHIRVIGPDNNEWGDKLLGNETIADVKIDVRSYDKGMKGVYPIAIRVVDHVEYKSNEFPPMTKDDEYYKAPDKDDFKKDFGIEESDADNEDLDDEVPF